MISMKAPASVIACFLLCITITVTAQKNGPDVNNPPAKTIFGEIGAPGVLSINYDQRFKGQKGLGFRVGFGGINILIRGFYTVPVGLNYLYGSKADYIEMGAGASANFNNIEVFYTHFKSSGIIGYLILGYRYQPEKKGFTCRIYFCPVFDNTGFFPLYGGVSGGIRF